MNLFNNGYLGDFTNERLNRIIGTLEQISEDEVLSRSTGDLVSELVARAHLEPLIIGANPIDGGVAEGTIEIPDQFGWGDRDTIRQRVFNLHAVYEFSGDADLFYYTPQTSVAFTRIQADIDTSRQQLTVRATVNQNGTNESAARSALNHEIELIRKDAAYASADVANYNKILEGRIRPAVEGRKKLLQTRRNLAGALGFPLHKRRDAPSPVPIRRTQIGIARTLPRQPRTPYRDEPGLTDAQYEDVIAVIKSTILAMERTPSVVANGDKEEEEIRDLILVPLNGTFEGNATGETFVKSGKTDILGLFAVWCGWAGRVEVAGRVVWGYGYHVVVHRRLAVA